MISALADADVASLKLLWQQVQPEVAAADHLEMAAQAVTRKLFETFPDSIALARAFLTVPLEALPAANQTFVQALATRAGILAELKPTTSVLSLIGTFGGQDAWCDRRRSQGHVGIPLVSVAFVDGIPMVSRLLQQLGMKLDWLERGDTSIMAKVLGSSSGVFYVAEASQETDRLGRKVIAAQDFVADHHIRSVFGFGGSYFGGSIVTFILFCTKAIDRSVAQRFAPLANLFKAATVALAGSTSVFSGD
jgi:hypothetical protein